jgi:6-phosphogluconolactonase (cycloisomerase 2 family)
MMQRVNAKKGVLVPGFIFLLWMLAGCGSQITDTPRFAWVLSNPVAASGPSVGTVTVFSVLKSTGVLSPIGQSFNTGKNPVAVTSDLHGRLLYVANTDDNSVSAFGINRADGTTFVAPGSPFPVGGANPIALAIDRATHFLFIADNGSSTITVARIIRADASLKMVKGSPFATPDPPINLAVAPSGKFLYAAVGTNGIEVLSVNPSGALALVNEQASPTGNTSNLVLSPDGKFLFAVDDDTTVSAYTVDAVTGKLTLVAGSPFAAGDQPAAVAIDPSGRFLYVANQGSNDISAYAINADGSLKQISGSPFLAGIQPLAITVDPSGRFVYTTNLSDQSVSLFIISSGGAGNSGPAGALSAVNTTSASSPVFMTITR